MNRNAVLRYVEYLAPYLDLADWSFRISEEPAGPDALASVMCPDTRKQAAIRVSDNMQTEWGSEIHYSLIHELVHCTMWKVGVLVERLRSRFVGGTAGELFYEAFTLVDESTTDHLALCFARLIPMHTQLINDIQS